MRVKPFFVEIAGQVAADESAGAGDDDQIVLLQRRVLFNESFFVFHKFILCWLLNVALKITLDMPARE